MSIPSAVDHFVERAQQVQAARMDAIRTLAENRQGFVDERAKCDAELAELQATHVKRLAAGEREDLRSYNAALSAGWTVDELRKIGFSEPEKKARSRRRSTSKARAKAVPAQVEDDVEGGDDHQG